MAAQIALINPRKRRKSRAKRTRRVVARRRSPAKRRRAVGYVVGSRKIRRRKLNPVRRSVARRFKARRRNPGFGMSGIKSAIVPAAIGGAGAVALDIGLAYVPGIPDVLKSGWGKVGLQVGGAFALGWLAKFVVSREVARNVTLGALTVAAYGAIRTVVQQVAPALPGVNGSLTENVGAYMPELGYANPAPFVDNPITSEVGAYMNDGM